MNGMGLIPDSYVAQSFWASLPAKFRSFHHYSKKPRKKNDVKNSAVGKIIDDPPVPSAAGACRSVDPPDVDTALEGSPGPSRQTNQCSPDPVDHSSPVTVQHPSPDPSSSIQNIIKETTSSAIRQNLTPRKASLRRGGKGESLGSSLPVPLTPRTPRTRRGKLGRDQQALDPPPGPSRLIKPPFLRDDDSDDDFIPNSPPTRKQLNLQHYHRSLVNQGISNRMQHAKG